MIYYVISYMYNICSKLQDKLYDQWNANFFHIIIRFIT